MSTRMRELVNQILEAARASAQGHVDAPEVQEWAREFVAESGVGAARARTEVDAAWAESVLLDAGLEEPIEDEEVEEARRIISDEVYAAENALLSEAHREMPVLVNLLVDADSVRDFEPDDRREVAETLLAAERAAVLALYPHAKIEGRIDLRIGGATRQLVVDPHDAHDAIHMALLDVYAEVIEDEYERLYGVPGAVDDESQRVWDGIGATEVTRGYMTQVDENGDDLDAERPMTCNDCGRPCYYDYEDDQYHHATDCERGCFLIDSEEREDDTRHPLVGKGGAR